MNYIKNFLLGLEGEREKEERRGEEREGEERGKEGRTGESIISISCCGTVDARCLLLYMCMHVCACHIYV